jgi:hypothetical protein
MIWSLALLLGQIPPPVGKPEDVAKLRPAEIVRMYKYGGKTRGGVFHSLLIIGKDFTVTVKDQEGTHRTKLSASQQKELKGMLNTSTWKALTAEKRVDAYPPSAADATDIYLNFRDGKVVRTWSNVKWQYPGSTSILEALDRYAFSAKHK